MNDAAGSAGRRLWDEMKCMWLDNEMPDFQSDVPRPVDLETCDRAAAALGIAGEPGGGEDEPNERAIRLALDDALGGLDALRAEVARLGERVGKLEDGWAFEDEVTQRQTVINALQRRVDEIDLAHGLLESMHGERLAALEAGGGEAPLRGGGGVMPRTKRAPYVVKAVSALVPGDPCPACTPRRRKRGDAPFTLLEVIPSGPDAARFLRCPVCRWESRSGKVK